MSKKKKKSSIQEWVEMLLIAIAIAAVVRLFLIGNYAIPSGSMEPTLLVGDRIIATRLIYGVKIPFFRNTIIPVSQPKRGEIIIFIYPEDRSKDYIKRVVGIAGDTIEIRNKVLFVNNEVQQEDHIQHIDPAVYPRIIQPRDNFGPVTVPPQSLFVMGDNRDASLDSRFWGFVDLKDVQGKAFVIYWSWDRFGEHLSDKPRFNRLGSLLH